MDTILIIDPNSTYRNFIKSLFNDRHRFDFQEYKTHHDAIEVISSEKLESGFILIGDNSDNSDLLNSIESYRKHLPLFPVVLLTRPPTIENLRFFVSCGVDQILVAPFTQQQLKEKLESSYSFRQLVLRENSQIVRKAHFLSQTEKLTDSHYKVFLNGWLGENAQLPSIRPAESNASIFIDCDLISGLNSIGIRSWLLWLKLLKQYGFRRFEFENLHFQTLSAAGLVSGFLPLESSVNSFFLHYFNEEFSIDEEFRFIRGRDFIDNIMSIPKHIQTVRGSRQITLEIDPSYKKNLLFFKGYIEIK